MSDILETTPPDVSVVETDAPASSSEIVDQGFEAEAPETETPETSVETIQSDDDWSITDDDITNIISEENQEEAKAPEAEEENVETKEALDEKKTEAEPEKAEEAEPVQAEEKSEETLPEDEKLNWKTAPEPFREQYEQTKKELLSLKKNSLEKEYLVNPQSFLQKLRDKSESQFFAVVQETANMSAQANPDGWIDYLIQTNADRVAQKLFGDEKITRERAIAERDMIAEKSYLFDEWAEQQAEEAKDTRTPEQIEADVKAQYEKQSQENEFKTKKASLTQKVAEPIYAAVDRVFEESKLEVSPDDSPEEKAFKQLINKVVPLYITSELEKNEEISPIFNQMNKFIEVLDEKGAESLSMDLVGFAEDTARSLASAASFWMKKAVDKRTEVRDPKPPLAIPTGKQPAAPAKPAKVETVNSDDDDDWSISSSDWNNVITRQV